MAIFFSDQLAGEMFKTMRGSNVVWNEYNSQSVIRYYTGTPPTAHQFRVNGDSAYASQYVGGLSNFGVSYSNGKFWVNPPPSNIAITAQTTGVITWAISRSHQSRPVMGSVGGPYSTDMFKVNDVNVVAGEKFYYLGMELQLKGLV